MIYVEEVLIMIYFFQWLLVDYVCVFEIQDFRVGLGLQERRIDVFNFGQECFDLLGDVKQVIKYIDLEIWCERQFKNINLEVISRQVVLKSMKVGVIVQRNNLEGEDNLKQNYGNFIIQILCR